jgi:hypothetical protein
MDTLARLVRRGLSIRPVPVRRSIDGGGPAATTTQEADVQYALLIYGQEPTEQPSGDALEAEMAGYNAFTATIREAGAFRGGEALHPIATATTVRVRDGQTLTTDGPFAETKEALGGFYIVEAADLDEAIAYAALIPGAANGSVEVRPIVDWADTGMGAPVEAASAV